MRNRVRIATSLAASGLLLSACGLPSGTGPTVTMLRSYDQSSAKALCTELFGTTQQVQKRFGLPRVVVLVNPVRQRGPSITPSFAAVPNTFLPDSPNVRVEKLLEKTAFTPYGNPGATSGITGCTWKRPTDNYSFPPNLYLGFVLHKYQNQIPKVFGVGVGPQVDIVAVDTLPKPAHPMSYYDKYLSNVAKRLRLG